MPTEIKNWQTPDGCTYHIGHQIAEIERELAKRKEVYERLIKQDKMSRATANRQYGRLANAKRSLQLLQNLLDPEQTRMQL